MAVIQYLGHSAFYIEGANLKALVDPFFPSDEAKAAAHPYYEKGAIDHIFLTHAHGDHMGDTIKIAKTNEAQVFAVNELATYLNGKGVKTIGMHIGGRAPFPFGRVKMTTATHGSSIWESGDLVFSALPCGFVIEVDGKKIYHAGDTGLTMDMALLEAEAIDAALLPIGGFYTMDLDDAVRAVDLIKPKLAIPMHYDTFPAIKCDPAEFASKVKGASARVLKIGEKIEL